MKRKNGFSFIELIVVITIIMVVTVGGMMSFSAAGAKSRDSRRIADMEKVRIALELYRQQTGTYPNVPTLLYSGATKYIDRWPDAIKGYQYSYAPGNPLYTYMLYGYMEDNGSTRPCPGSCPSVCAGAPSNACNYYVSNP